MDLQAILIELAEEHLDSMRRVPWDAHARSIRRRWPASAGETFGCEIDGIYFDIGDNARWVDALDGDILLIAHATNPDGVNPERVERSVIIPRPA
ncbi:hypothetical protein ASD79_16835 [Caulobacter sp. Root655]|uniref:hypothetical protein n=1 Tax=Caulobacter sp. Root655 TaxID=1736578 RepID=UPI0006F295D4|nr:hypothetical protein [Caulobacter sp. Root655]KRA56726.1 hypothetical protein ASD79_16835 [Caulobacter sp. Root655]